MKGTRPLDNDEIRSVSTCFTGTFAVRNSGLFMLGVSTGGRISELLSLRVGDVYQNKKPVTDLLYTKRIVKGGEVSRSVPVNADGRRAIDELVNWHREKYRRINATCPLFPSRHNAGTVALHRQTAHAILKDAFIEAGLNGHIATHSLRKSFAQRLYDKTGDIYLVQELLGHRNISTTQNYLGVNYADAKAAVEAIALISESDRIPLVSHSPQNHTKTRFFQARRKRDSYISRGVSACRGRTDITARNWGTGKCLNKKVFSQKKNQTTKNRFWIGCMCLVKKVFFLSKKNRFTPVNTVFGVEDAISHARCV